MVFSQNFIWRVATSSAVAFLVACGGGATHTSSIPHGIAPPYVVAFQLHYNAPADVGGPSTLSVTPYREGSEIASDGVQGIRLYLFGHESELIARMVSSPGADERYEFQLPDDFTPGAFPCGAGQNVSVVTVTSNYGHVLSQSFEVCPGLSKDFPPVYDYY